MLAEGPMEDAEFLEKFKERIKEFSGQAVELELGEHGAFEIDIERPVPKVRVGKEVLEFPGRARMLMQYTVLCLREHRQVSEDEFLRYLQRN